MTDTEWWALIGPVAGGAPGTPLVTPHDLTRRLARPVQVGGLTISPGGKLLVEHHRTDPMDLDGIVTIESWPVVVEGTETVLPWQRSAASKSVTISQLLSLAWNEPWAVRTAPIPTSNRLPQVPNSWPHRPEPPLAVQLLDSNPEAHPPVELPSWIRHAYERIPSNEDCRYALAAWHEGLLL